MKASVRVRAEPTGYSVWIIDADPCLVTVHSQHGKANACAMVLAKQGGCGKSRVCESCSIEFKQA